MQIFPVKYFPTIAKFKVKIIYSITTVNDIYER